MDVRPTVVKDPIRITGLHRFIMTKQTHEQRYYNTKRCIKRLKDMGFAVETMLECDLEGSARLTPPVTLFSPAIQLPWETLWIRETPSLGAELRL